MSEDSLKESLIEAVSYAQQAVKHDFVGPKGDLQKAAHLYQNAVDILSEILDSFPPDLQPKVQAKISAYQSRLAQLNDYFCSMKAQYEKVGIKLGGHGRNMKTGKKSDIPPIVFKEDSTLSTKFMSLPPPPPDNPEFRTFWLMNILLGTIDRGAFLTTKIWVPKEVWFQSDFQLPCQLEKMASLKCVLVSLDKLPKLTMKDPGATLSDLQTMYQDLEIIQNHLAHMVEGLIELKLNYEGSREKKIFQQRRTGILERIKNAKAEAKDAECADTKEYIDTIVQVIHIGVNLERLMKVCKGPESQGILDSMKQINNFFNVMLGWILADLSLLMKEYFRKCKASFLEVPEIPNVSAPARGDTPVIMEDV